MESEVGERSTYGDWRIRGSGKPRQPSQRRPCYHFLCCNVEDYDSDSAGTRTQSAAAAASHRDSDASNSSSDSDSDSSDSDSESDIEMTDTEDTEDVEDSTVDSNQSAFEALLAGRLQPGIFEDRDL